ncbi:hypothetical protein WEU32_10065 [Brevundimonas sp. BH3]|uniref:hypothetical protein n=1 Tax=Brevundimonas sp. BH3 TaxID=3133089 RepID=UPI003251A977
MTDPIFQAASYLERVCAEISHLSEEVARAISEQGFEIKLHDSNLVSDNQMSGLRYAFSYAVKRVFRNQKKNAQILLKFDLWRSDHPSDWPHAKEALLIVAYDADLVDGWDSEQLDVQADGRLERPDLVSELHQRCDNRLLLWERRINDRSFARQAWYFGVRLCDIHDINDSQRMIVGPLVALLRTPETAAEVLARAEAVVWPEHRTGGWPGGIDPSSNSTACL